MDADLDLGRALVAAGWTWTAYTPVIEAGQSGMTGCRGVVLPSVVRPGELCVRWAGPPLGPKGWMETGITHGTVPDLDHDGAAGVIVGMLREAVQGWTVEILMLRAHVEVCVGSPGSGGRTVHVDTSLGRAAARAWLSIKERA